MKFAMVGVGGYIAKRHLQAIRDTGNELVAAMDVHDSVGILDSYFPETDFFTEFERFERYLEKLYREGRGIDYFVICTPNYLHDAHIRCGLRVGADIICEKPVTIKLRNLDAVLSLAKQYHKQIYTIMQMRLHPLLKKIQIKPFQYIEIEYIVPRGRWYDYSWKGNVEKSGGLIYNLGIHFIDLMVYLFGKSQPDVSYAEIVNPHKIKGKLVFEKSNVDWELSNKGNLSKRIVRIDNVEYDFSKGFENLHTECYKSILKGEDLFNANSVRETIGLVEGLSE